MGCRLYLKGRLYDGKRQIHRLNDFKNNLFVCVLRRDVVSYCCVSIIASVSIITIIGRMHESVEEARHMKSGDNKADSPILILYFMFCGTQKKRRKISIERGRVSLDECFFQLSICKLLGKQFARISSVSTKD